MSGNVTLETAHHSCRHAHFPSAFALSTKVLVETAKLKKSELLLAEVELQGCAKKLPRGLLTMHLKERLPRG